MILSVYLLNEKHIKDLATFTKRKIVGKKIITDHKEIKSDTKENKLAEENHNFSLVEKIEELGFIPSIENNDESNAA